MRPLLSFEQIIERYDTSTVLSSESEPFDAWHEDAESGFYSEMKLYRRSEPDFTLAKKYPRLEGTPLEKLYQRYFLKNWNIVGSGISASIHDALAWPKGEAIFFGTDYTEGFWILHVPTQRIFREHPGDEAPTYVAESFDKLIRILEAYSWEDFGILEEKEFEEVLYFLDVVNVKKFWLDVRRVGTLPP